MTFRDVLNNLMDLSHKFVVLMRICVYFDISCSVQFISVTQLCLTLCDPMDCSTPGFLVHHHLLELAQTHVHRVGDAIQPTHPLLHLPSIFPNIRVFSNESVLRIQWSKYWSFSFSISPSREYLGLISFRVDVFYFLAVQGTLKSLLQHHSSKASILQHSGFFSPTLTSIHDHWKNHSLTRRTFIDKVMSLLTHYYTKHTMPFTLFNPPNAPNEAALLPSLYR